MTPDHEPPTRPLPDYILASGHFLPWNGDPELTCYRHPDGSIVMPVEEPQETIEEIEEVFARIEARERQQAAASPLPDPENGDSIPPLPDGMPCTVWDGKSWHRRYRLPDGRIVCGGVEQPPEPD